MLFSPVRTWTCSEWNYSVSFEGNLGPIESWNFKVIVLVICLESLIFLKLKFIIFLILQLFLFSPRTVFRESYKSLVGCCRLLCLGKFEHSLRHCWELECKITGVSQFELHLVIWNLSYMLFRMLWKWHSYVYCGMLMHMWVAHSYRYCPCGLCLYFTDEKKIMLYLQYMCAWELGISVYCVQLHIWGLSGFIQMVHLSGLHWPLGTQLLSRTQCLSLDLLNSPLLALQSDPAMINGQSSVPHPSCSPPPILMVLWFCVSPLTLPEKDIDLLMLHSSFCGLRRKNVISQ